MLLRTTLGRGLALASLGLLGAGLGCTPRTPTTIPAAAATASTASPKPEARPCFVVQGGGALREADAKKMLATLVANVHLSPADEALRSPKSLEGRARHREARSRLLLPAGRGLRAVARYA
jgi:hypothetical protein